MEIKEWLGKDNELGQTIWNNKYRKNDETLDEWFERVSGGDEEVKQLIKERKFIFGGRVLANRGVKNGGSYSNCYTYGRVPDSLDGILAANTAIAKTFKAQGGQGISLSDIRPKGSHITGGYDSDGIIPFMKLFNQTTSTISQGGSRKGALMISLDAKHAEIMDFITIKSNSEEINKANLSVEIDNEFMKAVEKSLLLDKELTIKKTHKWGGQSFTYEIKPLKIFKAIAEYAWDNGEPGILFMDKLKNYNLMEHIKDYDIQSTNPCLRAGTNVLTEHGVYPIEKLVDRKFQTITLDNEYADSKCFSSGVKQLYEVELENGLKYYSTKEHKWPVLHQGRYMKVTTDELAYGDWLPFTQVDCLSDGTLGDEEDGFLLGYWYGNGALIEQANIDKYYFEVTSDAKEAGILDRITKKLSQIRGRAVHYEEKAIMYESDYIYTISCMFPEIKEYMKKFGVTSHEKLPKHILNELSEDFRHGFIDGLISARGYFAKPDLKTAGMTIYVFSEELAKEVSELFWWYGIRNSWYALSPDENGDIRYNVGFGRNALCDFRKMFSISMPHKQETLEAVPETSQDRITFKNIKVVSIKPLDIEEEVYDITVFNDSHTFRLNHCVTGNCGEQPLIPNGSCLLSSLNLYEFVDEKFTPNAAFNIHQFEKAVRIAVRAMDDLVDENADKHALQEQRDIARDYRNIGIGVLGYADMLMALGLTYGSEEAQELSDYIFNVMFMTAVEASSDLAKERGAFPKFSPKMFDSEIFINHFSRGDVTMNAYSSLLPPEYLKELRKKIMEQGMRNCSLLSVAPTGSTL